MSNKQSSIERLVEILGKYNEEMVFLYKNEIEQAKAMHKEEIINAWYNGYLNQSPMPDEENCGEIFYNETFSDESNN